MSKAKQDLWASMTRKQRKVAIAKDVIAQIQAKKYNIQASVGYVCPIETKTNQERVESHFKKVKSVTEPVSDADVEVLTKNCTMCARGAALMSRIRKFNTITRDQMDIYLIDDEGDLVYPERYAKGKKKVAYASIDTNQSTTTIGLAGAFTEAELIVIESAFEQSPYFGNTSTANFLAVDFGKDIEDDADRLLAIMQNIVDNDGVFRPEQTYEIVSY